MSEPTELDQRIEDLRGQVRAAMLAGDRARARALRRQLRDAEQAWHDSLAELDSDESDSGELDSDAGEKPGEPSARQPLRDVGRAGSGELLLPMREQVHQALTLLTVPAGPRLISAVHEAMFSGAIPAARLTSVRRDEERSFRSAPFARPYYLCAALTADLLSPARGLLAISTWPMDRRIIGPLSPRVDYLTAAVRIAENVGRNPDFGDTALRLLRRFAARPGRAPRTPRSEPTCEARRHDRDHDHEDGQGRDLGQGFPRALRDPLQASEPRISRLAR
jgi:hypothetical protein